MITIPYAGKGSVKKYRKTLLENNCQHQVSLRINAIRTSKCDDMKWLNKQMNESRNERKMQSTYSEICSKFIRFKEFCHSRITSTCKMFYNYTTEVEVGVSLSGYLGGALYKLSERVNE